MITHVGLGRVASFVRLISLQHLSALRLLFAMLYVPCASLLAEVLAAVLACEAGKLLRAL